MRVSIRRFSALAGEYGDRSSKGEGGQLSGLFEPQAQSDGLFWAWKQFVDRTHPTETLAAQSFDVTTLLFLSLAPVFLGLTVKHPDLTVYKAGAAQDKLPLLFRPTRVSAV